MDGRAAIHVAGRPLLLVSTDYWTWDSLVNRLRSVAIKSRPELTQCLAGHPLGPFDLWFGPTWSTCHTHSYNDTIFGEFQMFLQFLEMLQFSTYVPEIQ
jgi:hypothetical protein